MLPTISSRSLTTKTATQFISKNFSAKRQAPHDIVYVEPTDTFKPPHQEGASYYCNGFSIPLDLIKAANKEYLLLVKKNKKGLRCIFEQIAYICLTQESGMCFKKQKTLGEGCTNAGHKSLSTKQVGRLESTLIALGLYTRSRHPNRKLSYDRALTPLGSVVYLLLSKKIYFLEKMSQRNQKNVPSQFLRHKRKILINTSVGDSKERPPNSSPPNNILLKFEEESGIKVTNIDRKYQFAVTFAGEEAKTKKTSISEMTKMRKMLDDKLEAATQPTSGDYSYLQKVFREQAQRQIDITKQRLNSTGAWSFKAMQERAYDNALIKMRDMGLFNEENKVIKGTDEDAKKLFDIYYEAFLTREKRSKEPQSMVALMQAIHPPRK